MVSRSRAVPSSAAGSLLAVALLGIPLLSGCTRDGHFRPVSMWNESRLKPLEESPLAEEQSSSLPLVPGTVARGDIGGEDPSTAGRVGNQLATKLPFPVTAAVLARGQDRFNIYCSPCHNRIGDGEGMIVKRGFPHPPDYAIPRLRNAPVGHFYNVMTNGYGVMYSYAARVPPSDRWAIAAYIRLLQADRPVVPVDRWAAQRIRARATGVGTRPVQP
jgi:mono/diheme cytochrome c family protein